MGLKDALSFSTAWRLLMNRLHIATRGACDWRLRLGDPEKHWKRRASAMETAVSWQNASRTTHGLPQPIADAILASDFGEAKLLLAVAEHKVRLEGMGGDAQCDVWALLDTRKGTTSLSVEAKAKEPFGDNNQVLANWLHGGKSVNSKLNREKRWEDIRKNLPARELGAYDSVPYQILQRCAAAVIEARRFRLAQAIFLVQSFNAIESSFEHYSMFASVLGLPATRGRLEFTNVAEIRLAIGWVDCCFATDSQLAAAFEGER